MLRRSEKNLQTELHVEGFSGADARSAVEVADGVADNTAARSGCTNARSEIHAVEGVERFDAKLSFDPFRDRNVLEHGEVQISETGTVDLVPTQRAAEHVGSTTSIGSSISDWQAERGRIDPGHAAFIERVRNPSKRIRDLVVSRAELIDRLPAVECHQTIHSPSMRQPFRTMLGTRNIPGQGGREVVASVEVAISVFRLQVGAIEWKAPAIGAVFIGRMRPSVGKLRGQAVPCSQAQRALQCVVVGSADAVELVDAAVVRILGERSIRMFAGDLIDIQHDRQLPAFAAHVADLQDRYSISKTLLHVQVVVEEIRRAEVLVYCENVESEGPAGSGINAISCVGRGISTHASRDLVENILVRVPGVGSLAQGIGAVSRNRGRTSRIVFQSVRIVGWPEIKERVHVVLVIEDANAATYDQFFASGGLIGKTNARSEVILVGWKNGTDSVALNLNASSRRHEDGEVLAAVVQWSEVIPAKSPVEV